MWYMPRAMQLVARVALIMAMFGAPGCSCSRLDGEVDDLEFTRCGQAEPAGEGGFTHAGMRLEVRDREATLSLEQPAVLGVFTGPIERPLGRDDIAMLSRSGAKLFLMLGGLGDGPEAARASLEGLATLDRPVFFVAGGADRLEVVHDAFESVRDALPAGAGERLVDLSALRVLRIGRARFGIVAGAPLGRYALDEDGCGFVPDDLDEVREALLADKGPTWLLSWAAPADHGVTRGHGGVEAGSMELAELAKAVGARGGLFAYPEVQAGSPAVGGDGKFALVVPRLGRTGSLREGRGFVPRGLSLVSVSSTGLAPLARP
jgi:hypothetical protein